MAARYGAEHQRARAAWAQRIANGARPSCARCGWPVLAGEAWDLDHAEDGLSYLGPAHMRCNRGAGGRKSQRLRRRRDETIARRTSREW